MSTNKQAVPASQTAWLQSILSKLDSSDDPAPDWLQPELFPTPQLDLFADTTFALGIVPR